MSESFLQYDVIRKIVTVVYFVNFTMIPLKSINGFMMYSVNTMQAP